MTMMRTLPRNISARVTPYGLAMALFALLAAACLFADEPAQSPASPPTPATRVALVPSGNCSGVSLDAMSVAEAQLASSTQVKVLDRQTIDKTLHEHEISLGGLVDTDLAIKTGKILTTDLLAVLEGSAGGDGKPQGIVVFDVKTGVRLCDETLAAATPDRWAGDIAAVVEVAVEKYRAPPQAVTTLSIVGVRNVDMSAERDAFCEAVGRLLERELIRSSGIAILERQHLEQVLRERAISPEAPENALLASSQSIHLEITQYKQSGIGVAAILTDPAGQTHRVAVADEDSTVTAAVTNLSTEILKTLNAKPPQGQPNRQADAERMCREAEADFQASRWEQAVVCAEATMAIYPEDHDMPWEAAWHFLHLARYQLNPKMAHADDPIYEIASVPPQNIELAAASLLRCVDLMAQQYEYEAAHNGIAAYTPLFVNNWYEDVPNVLMLLSLTPGERTERASQVSDRLFQRFRRLMCDVVIPAWEKAWQKEFKIEYLQPYVIAVSSSRNYFFSSAAWTDAVVEHGNETLRFLDRGDVGLARGERLRLYDSRGARIMDDQHAFSYVFLLTPFCNQSFSALWGRADHDYGRLRELFDRMTRHRLPGVQIFGMSGLLWVDQMNNQLTPEQVRGRARTIFDFAKKKIADPRVADADPERVACYEALLNVINTAALQSTDRIELIDELFAFMLSRKEVVEGVIEIAGSPHIYAYANYYPARYGYFRLGLPWRLERPKHDLPKTFQDVLRLQSLISSQAIRFSDGCATESQKRVKDAIDLYASIDPNLVPNGVLSPAPWTTARNLLDTYNHPEIIEGGLSRPVVHGDDIYVVGYRHHHGGNSTRSAELLRISTTTGKAELISKLILGPPSPDRAAEVWVRPLCSPQISDEKLYCATPVSGGIAVFPLDGSTPTRISKETTKGMPTDVFDQIVVVGNKIFALTSGLTSYVHWYDPDGEGWQVIASSRRAQQRTAVDRPHVYVGGAVYDPYHRRILFSKLPLFATDNFVDPQHGLFQFDIQSRDISKVTAFRRAQDWLWPQGGELLWGTFNRISTGGPFSSVEEESSEGIIYEFAMKTNRWREVYRARSSGNDPIANAERVDRQMPNVAAFSPPFALIDGWLWSFDPLGRISPDGTVVEKFHDLLKNKKRPYPVVNDYNVLEYLPERHAILYGDPYALWCLELPPQAVPPPSAAPVQ